MVRFGIIGIGNMGRSHLSGFVAGKVKDGKVTAICDINPEKLKYADEIGADVKKFTKAEDLLTCGEIDAVVIATPHYFHPEYAKIAFDNNLHVLIEKPAGVYTKQVREMNERAAKSDKIFGIMYNQRTNPVYQKIRDLITSGELGAIKRINWIITDWYRPQAYHDSSDWRSSWGKEGGGALINQCPHQLDLWQWLFGMPQKIHSFVGFGKYHDIEVEDEVTAYMEYENGVTGVFITSTAEAPGTNRLEIACDKGRLVVENGTQISFKRLRGREREFNATNTVPFGTPECWDVTIPVNTSGGPQHVGIFNDFVSAVEKGTKLLAPGEEGINGLTISNCIHMSAWTGETIEVAKLDEDKYYEILQDKIKNSTYKKNVREVTATDMSKTF